MASSADLTRALDARLIEPLPDPIEIGRGTAVFVHGECRTEGVDPGSVELELAGIRQPADAFGMPEPLSIGPGPQWWALLPLPDGTREGEATLRLRVTIDGRRLERTVATTTIVRRDAAAAPPAPSIALDQADGDRPLIAICMATYEPRPDHLAGQLESIRAQSWLHWVCVISDDGSSPERWDELRRAVGDDPRFIVSRSEVRRGFYGNFERALRMAPPEASLITLADQDDEWDPDKLEASWEALAGRPDSQLVFSDMRIVNDRGERISDTYWTIRRNCYDDIASVIVANTVTGAASLFRRELLDYALPFPPTHGEPYHDHWLALCALALGEIAYLDRPTYTHIRHDESVTMRARAGWGIPALTRWGRWKIRALRLGRRLRRGLLRPGWRWVYLHRYMHLVQFATVLELRVGDRMDESKRRALRRLASADRSPRSAGWLALRSLRPWIGRNETLSRERVLLGGVAWRRLVGLSARLRHRSPG